MEKLKRKIKKKEFLPGNRASLLLLLSSTNFSKGSITLITFIHSHPCSYPNGRASHTQQYFILSNSHTNVKANKRNLVFNTWTSS